MHWKLVFLFFLLLSNLLIVEGDECRCRCCQPKPCEWNLLPNVFHIDQCWRGGGRICLQRCIEEYPQECGSDSSAVVPACRASLTISLNGFIILMFSFIHRLFLH